MPFTRSTKKAVDKIKKDNETGARRDLIEDLFYDFHKSRAQVYKMNFIRGIFFGLGSVIGGTIVVALIVWSLSLFVHIPGLGDSVKQIQNTLERTKK
jgi:hypothetical protein